ncbi:hypothetical protein [Aeromonas jandaei]|uniref:hypothetical protein n=1 Tax=Aeromonas jandaei TaxID=650 RepID=UPI002B05CA26|nr:hypothetical protein [Aeromonas jandaei]
MSEQPKLGHDLYPVENVYEGAGGEIYVRYKQKLGHLVKIHKLNLWQPSWPVVGVWSIVFNVVKDVADLKELSN